jgi:antitoxin component of RelBE/YafQ-DinJ toxin-antitoxin module
MDLARKQMPTCVLSHMPNADTIRSIEESEQGIGIERFDSLDDFSSVICVPQITECLRLQRENF